MKKIAGVMPLMILMTACFSKEAKIESHRRHTDYSSTVEIGDSTSETSGSENENATVLSIRTKFFSSEHKDTTVLSTHTETSDKVTIIDLWEAIEEGNRRTVGELIKNPEIKKHINTQNEQGETAFSLAAKETLFPKVFAGGDRRAKIKVVFLWIVMRNLLSSAADPNLIPEEHFQEIQQAIATVTDDTTYSDTFLMYLVRTGELDSVEKLLEMPSVKENINARNKNGETAFFLAKRKKHTQIMELLLKADANPDIVPSVAGER